MKDLLVMACAGIALVCVLLMVGASGCCSTAPSLVPYSEPREAPAQRAARVAAQNASPVPSTRCGVVVIAEVHEMFTTFDTVRVTNWGMHTSGRWYVLISGGGERWSDKAPVPVEVSR